MPDYAADDAASIAYRLKELAAERAKIECATCERVGWKFIYGGWVTCGACDNPFGKEKPEYVPV